MSLVGKLVERDGALFVVYESTRYSEPILDRLWWRVERVNRNPYNARWPQAGDTAKKSAGDGGVWHCWNDGGVTGDVVFNPKTEAAHRDVEPVPCPKVRRGVKTRWKDGRWEKLLKSGWTPA
jgi:hypothetical protein